MRTLYCIRLIFLRGAVRFQERGGTTSLALRGPVTGSNKATQGGGATPDGMKRPGSRWIGRKRSMDPGVLRGGGD